MTPTDTNPQVAIGTLASYIRFHPTEGILKGKGYVKAYGLDPENRIIALVQDKKRKDPTTGKPLVFNVPARGVNYTKQFETDLHELVGNVETVTGAANAAIAKLTREANDELTKMNDEVLGARLELPEAVAEDEPETDEPQA